MLAQRQLVAMPSADDKAFAPSDDVRWVAIRNAHDAIQPMFWGPRTSVDDACASIRRWVAGTLA